MRQHEIAERKVARKRPWADLSAPRRLAAIIAAAKSMNPCNNSERHREQKAGRHTDENHQRSFQHRPPPTRISWQRFGEFIAMNMSH
jgi:hypothetical protein